MNPFAFLFGFILLAFSVFFVAGPFRTQELQKKSKGRGIQRKDSLKLSPENRRQAVLLALRDLDFDYRANKVAVEDYQSLRADLLSEAAKLMQSQDQQKDEAIEAMIQSRRKAHTIARLDDGSQPKAARVEKLCLNCQAPLLNDAKFCSKCGSPAADSACPKCGRSLAPDDRFCPACGTAVQPSTQDALS